MVESRANRELCRNCKVDVLNLPSQTHRFNRHIPSRSQIGTCTPRLDISEGFLVEFGPEQIAVASLEPTYEELDGVLASSYFYRKSIVDRAEQLLRSHVPSSRSDWRAEATDNARTALFEALTASGHLSTIDFEGAAEKVNQHCMQRLLNAWYVCESVEWERDRRFEEICEEITIHRTLEHIKSGKLPVDTMVATLSDYPDEPSDAEAISVGYRPKNKKGMVRVTYFSQRPDGSWQRHLEQISRSNSNDGSSQFLVEMLTDEPAQWLNGSTKMLATQLLLDTTVLPDRAVTLQAMLDAVNGEGVRYGNAPDDVTAMHPDYDHLREVSAERERRVAKFIGPLATAEVQLDKEFNRGYISYRTKLARYHRQIETAINEICLFEPQYAAEARGKKAAEYFERASVAYQSGNRRVAFDQLALAIQHVESGAAVVCGGAGEIAAQNDAETIASDTLDSADSKMQSWGYTKGYCRVKTCPSDGALTDVGPCSVCRCCEARFRTGTLKE